VNLEKWLDKPALRGMRTAVATVRAMIFVGTVACAAIAILLIAAQSVAVDPTAAVVLVAVLIALLTASTYAWYFVTRTYNPPFYKILTIEGSLVVDVKGDHFLYTYVRQQEVMAVRNDLRLVEIRAHWTGKGHPGTTHVESLFQEHAILDGKRVEADGRVYRWIYPRRALRRGKVVKVGVRQTHEDGIERQLPYFREGSGRYRAHKIVVTVRLPLNVHLVDSVQGLAWDGKSNVGGSEPVEDLPLTKSRVNPGSGMAEYTLSVDKPRPFHSYGIEWTWLNQPSD
jgi:hypothetical protein